MKFEPSDFPAGPRVVFSGWAGILIPVLVFIFLIHSAPANAGTMVNFCGMVTTGTSEFGSCAVSGGAMASGTVQQEDGFSDLVLGNINLSDPGPNAVSGTALLAQNNFDFPIFFVGPPGGEFPVGIQQQVKVDAFGVFTTTFPEVSDGTDFVNVSLLLTCTEPDLPCSPFSAEAGFQFPAGSSKYPGSGFQLGRIDNAGPGDLGTLSGLFSSTRRLTGSKFLWGSRSRAKYVPPIWYRFPNLTRDHLDETSPLTRCLIHARLARHSALSSFRATATSSRPQSLALSTG